MAAAELELVNRRQEGVLFIPVFPAVGSEVGESDNVRRAVVYESQICAITRGSSMSSEEGN